MFLMIDNYDSFVYNLVRYLEELQEVVQVYRNDKITLEEIEKMGVDGIFISPGPKSPKEAGICIEIIERFKGEIPILGICLGHQSIGHVFGAKVVKGKEPVHGKVYETYHRGVGVFKDLKNPIKVTRYHSLILEKETLPECLEITAESSDGVIMGIRHKEYCIEGVQFDPEAELTEEGHKLLKNFLDLCKALKKERKKGNNDESKN